jgi:hypothetical protein
MPSAVLTKPKTGSSILLGLALIGALVFIVGFALPYFSWNPAQFGPNWPKRGWLLLHICGGIVGILVGPFAIWLGVRRQRLALHRALGFTYLTAMGLSSLAALYLATHTDVSWVFGMGLGGLAVAWFVTTGLAWLSIRRRLIMQHQEWMIRSYVVTFAFVNFRWFAGALQAAGVGTLPDQLAAASWFCWSVPLLITEAVIQGRKIRNVARA